MTFRSARLPHLAVSALLVFAVACQRHADTATASTFAGAEVRILVGFRAGGPYDLHGRLLANHLGRHLPGNPTVIVENMPGAAGAVALKHLAGQTKADGLTIGLLSETSVADVISSEVASRFDLLGGPGAPPQIVLFTGRSGITNVDEWRRASKPPRFASTATMSPNYVVPLVTGAALGLPVQMVTGYNGFGEVRLAFDSGEIDAVCLSLDAYHTTFQSSDSRAVLRFWNDPLPGFDAPDARSLTMTAEGRDLLETGIYAMAPLVRFYATPRGVPPARLAQLREALLRTWIDPAFLSDATAAGLTIAPSTADTLAKLIAQVTSRPALVASLQSILQPR